MADEEQLHILKQGVDAWNKWRIDNPGNWIDFSGADLSGADLIRADLIKANLIMARLSGANLSGADLTGANLLQARLIEANLSGTDLFAANLNMVDLTNANLSKANLISANLAGAKLYGAILSGATVSLTVFANVDLSNVKGLEKVDLIGPSSIGIDTIYRSQGKIPEAFLRGSGVPENFIQYLPSLIGKAIQFFSCFISYSTKDQEFAERLHSDLQAKHVRVWFAPEDIKGGRKLHEQIPEAIRVHDKLLLLLSEHSMSSEWVKTEIYHARQDENRNNKRKLFPIGLVDFGSIRCWEAFDADSGKDMAREIREYFIPDFSNWKDHDAYKKAFDRLLGDLQAED